MQAEGPSSVWSGTLDSMRTHRRRRHTASLAGSALTLAAVLVLTACQQADPGAAGGESEDTTTASASPSGSGERPSSGSGSAGDSGGGDASESEQEEAEISASAMPDRLLPPDSDETRVMMKAVEETMGRPVARLQVNAVTDHRRLSEEVLELLADPDAVPIESEACRAAAIASAEIYAAATVQSTRLSGDQPRRGPDRKTMAAPYFAVVAAFEDSTDLEEYLQATLETADTAECADERSVFPGGVEHEVHQWGEGTRYTFQDDGGRTDDGGVYIGTFATAGNHLYSVTSSVEPGGDVAAGLDRQARTVDALAELTGAPQTAPER